MQNNTAATRVQTCRSTTSMWTTCKVVFTRVQTYIEGQWTCEPYVKSSLIFGPALSWQFRSVISRKVVNLSVWTIYRRPFDAATYRCWVRRKRHFRYCHITYRWLNRASVSCDKSLKAKLFFVLNPSRVVKLNLTMPKLCGSMSR